MPTNLTDVSTFTDPVAVPVDSDPRNAASVETPFQALANRTRYLLNQIETAGALIVHLSPAAGLQESFGVSEWDYGIGVGDPSVDSVDNGSELHFDLAQYLPDGATITDIDIMATEGAARALGSRMSVSLQVQTPTWTGSGSTAVTLYYSETGGGATSKIFSISDGVNAGTAWASQVVTKGTKSYTLVVRAGTDGGGHTGDRIEAIRVHYTAPAAKA